MLPEVEKVFDTSIYTRTPEVVRPQVLTEDVAGLVIEAGDRPLEERVNSRQLKIVGNTVIDPISKEDVRKKFINNTELQIKESASANSFYDYLLEKPGNLVISLSPSGGPANYEEARVNAGYRVNEQDIDLYGIPSHLNGNHLVGLAARLSEWNTEPLQIHSPEDLREISIPVQVPEGETPWEFLEEIAPLDSNAWQVITSGLPWEIKKKAELDAAPVAQEMDRRLAYATQEIHYVQIGAWGERAMHKAGWKLSASACPGLFNTQISLVTDIGRIQNSQFLSPEFSFPGLEAGLVEDAFGNLRQTKWEYHKGSCVNCSKEGVDVGPCDICKTCEKVL